jgi:hypothetical protein
MINIYQVFDTAAYSRVESEEGAYDTCVGRNVIASALDSDGMIQRYLYTGGNGQTPQVFTEADAATLVGRVKAAGFINERYWWNFESDDPNALPDYVLNPHREEYN